MRERIVLWGLRITVATLPFTVGSAITTWLNAHIIHDLPVFIATWTLWALLALSTLVPHNAARTTARIIAMSAAVFVLVEPSARADTTSVVNALVVFVLAFSPDANMWWINGTAYPNERRYPLRIPSLVAAGPLLVTYAAVIVLPTAALLSLSNDHWLSGAILTFASVVALLFGPRAIHQLGRRWIVFVPAGVVLHDPMSLVDPVLFQRSVIEKLAPAAADTDALDLTQSALGMSIELDLTEKVPMVLSKPFGSTESGSSARLMFTPSRPGAVLAEANRRKLPN